MYVHISEETKKAKGPPSYADANGHFADKLENCEHFFLLIPQYPHHISTCIVL